MLIAQASDLHLHADRHHSNHERFARTLDHLLGIDPLPDVLVLSGDLADDGSREAYQHLRHALQRWPRPVHLMMGNHDDRGQLGKAFPELSRSGGFVHAAVEYEDLRLILLDTTDGGRHGGSFCEARAAWLRGQLDGEGDRAVLIFMHHPPVDLGLHWVDPGPEQEWTQLFRAAVAGRPVAAICAGHVHASAIINWDGIPVVACPSTSSDLSLTFSKMNPRRPDGRVLVEQGEPAFALHRWSHGRLVSFFGRCPQQVLARWDEQTRTVVGEMIAERADSGSIRAFSGEI